MTVTNPKKLIHWEPKGTARELFSRGLYRTSIVGFRELGSNSMTWEYMANNPPEMKKIEITMNVGNNHDCIFEDWGPGIKDLDALMKYVGHEKDEEYEKRKRDPNFIGLFGWGIRSALGLSEIELVELHNVTVNARGLRTGAITTLLFDETEGPTFEEAEHADSSQLFDHLGVKIIIKRLKKAFTKEKIIEYLSEVFARKFSDGYKFYIRDAQKDIGFTLIQKPDWFCCTHEVKIGMLTNGYPVFADLHSVEKERDCKVDILVKKVKMDIYSSDHLCKGYAYCDGLTFSADREKVQIDEEHLFPEFKKIVEDYCVAQGFDKKNKPNDRKMKNEKRIQERAIDLLKKYQKLNPNQTPAPLRGITIQTEDNNATEDVIAKGWKDKKQKRKPRDPNAVTTPRIINPNAVPRTTHNHHPKVPKIIADDNNAEPYLSINRIACGKERHMIYIDLDENSLIINIDHECARKLLNDEKQSQKTWDMAIAIAVIQCFPENKNISHEEFFDKYWMLLDEAVV